MLAVLLGIAVVAGCGSENPDGDGGDGGQLDGGSLDGASDGSDGRDARVRDTGPGAECGDGRKAPSEACDDNNTMDGDGCSGDCSMVEPGYACPTPGQPCIPIDPLCGNGLIDEGEACDDGGNGNGDGCLADCSAVEPGWACPFPGVRCVAAECGDGIVAGFEECDDGDADPNDGCSDECKLEEGWACPTPGQACHPTTCGDEVVEGLEQCDDGNFDTGDGCSPFCTLEPRCTDGTCLAVCGDGLKLPSEQCDDGNTRNGDGCSSTCQIETGFACELVVQSPVLPIVYRDFIGTSGTDSNNPVAGNTGPVHLDFEKYNGCEMDVRPELDEDGKPSLLNRNSPSRSSGNCVESADSFAQWYRSDSSMTPINRTVVDRITFTAGGTPGTYLFAENNFYPLTGRGWNDPSDRQEQTRGDHSGTQRNFHFTSELRWWFTYQGGETLTFYGDDDVWVFINGKLAVDIAGVHGRRQRQITLGVPGSTSATSENNGTTRTFGYPNAEDLGLQPGGVYEVAVFQAERHTERSQYRLTLENFLNGRSRCASECGDGVIAADEACDDGVNDGSYGGCMPGCKLRAPFCGDRVVQSDEGEQCDDGLNLGGYDMCGPDCTWGPRCGDGIVQPEHGEACDDGNDIDTDACTNECKPGVV